MSNYPSHLSASNQKESNRPDQVKNNAGGFVFALDVWKRLERFLILGSDAPTYYQTARALTRENAVVVNEAWATDSTRTAQIIINISSGARAVKNDAAIFALALGAVHANVDARQNALASMERVCRTATHLFMFVHFASALGKGWGRGMKRAVANWYESKSAEDLAYQMIKYRQREGFTHNRLLDLSHPKGEGDKGNLYSWIVGKYEVVENTIGFLPRPVQLFIKAQADALSLDEYASLPWEAYPTEKLKDPALWKTILPTMGLTALVRNLAKMTAIGVLAPLSAEVNVVLERLRDQGSITRSRMHPLQFLTAMKVYSQGHGDKGSLRWEPIPNIVRALNDAFYLAFKNVEPSGKRYLLAIDVSGSMDNANVSGSSFTAREGAAAMALVTATMENNTHIVGFARNMSTTVRDFRSSTIMTPLNISAGQRLDDVCKTMAAVPMGGTDCAMPMLYAFENKIEVDTFVIYTDNETYMGKVHPYVALQNYRKAMGVDAKLVVVGMTSTGFTIADPRDAGMLDVVGFDANVPSLISEF